MKTRIYILSLAYLILLSSCAGKMDSGSIFKKEMVNIEFFQKTLYSKLKPVDTSDADLNKKLFSDLKLNLEYAYQLNGYKPFWFNSAGLNHNGMSLAEQLYALENEGLNPRNYQVASINNILHAVKNGGASNLDSVEKWDILMTQSFLHASKDLLLGTDTKVLDKNWFIKNDSIFDGAQVLANFALSNDSVSLSVLFSSFRPQNKLYTTLLQNVLFWTKLSADTNYLALKKHADFKEDSITNYLLKLELKLSEPTVFDPDSLSNYIAAYQEAHLLKVNSKIDEQTVASLRQLPDDYIKKLMWNMKRMQFMPRDFGNEFVWVNIPTQRMQLLRQDEIVFECKTVVGKIARATPSLVAPMTNVVINPPWTIPPTILKKDVYNGILKSGVGYLNRKGYHAINGKGKDVTESVNNNNYKHFTYRQNPGYRNALGTVKFNLPNKYHIYLHDTPSKGDFSSDNRARSSGCVRLGKAKEFAVFLLTSQSYDSTKIEETIKTRKSKTVKLEHAIPVYIVYLTNDINRFGDLVYLNDIYKIQSSTTD